MGIPYIEGVSDELSQVFRKHGIKTYHKSYNSIRSMLVRPKYLVYGLKCSCGLSYIGETARSLGTRVKEHQKLKGTNMTAVGDHLKETGHKLVTKNNKILARDDGFWSRKYREAIEIAQARPGLNHDTGLYIPPIYHTLLSADHGQQTGRPW